GDGCPGIFADQSDWEKPGERTRDGDLAHRGRRDYVGGGRGVRKTSTVAGGFGRRGQRGVGGEHSGLPHRKSRANEPGTGGLDRPLPTVFGSVSGDIAFHVDHYRRAIGWHVATSGTRIFVFPFHTYHDRGHRLRSLQVVAPQTGRD